MKLKPIEDRVVIELVDDLVEKKVGGIIVPDTAKDKPNIGLVVAVGTDKDLKEIVKAGDRVIYAKYSGTEIEMDGKKYLIVSKADIMAIVC
jgi:chaperonin GroES